MRLDYGTILCPEPITLSVGTIKNPKLKEIAKLGFDKFGYFEFLLKMNPEVFYTKVKGDDGKNYWDALTDEEKEQAILYDVIINDDKLVNVYIEIFNFFFVEPVVFRDGFFILLKEDINDETEINADNIRGVIAKDNMSQVLGLLQQICCIYEDNEDVNDLKFKNDLARKMYERMLKASREEKSSKKSDINLTLPNIISSISNKHPSINPINVWDLTIFQLLDSFNRMQVNALYDIDSTRVSVWGDEKKTFNASLWYKNEYDKR